MKKILLAGVLTLILTGCHMEPDQYSGQQIFYGETLITNKAPRENDQRNNSFIYDPYKEDCYDCEDFTDYFDEEDEN